MEENEVIITEEIDKTGRVVVLIKSGKFKTPFLIKTVDRNSSFYEVVSGGKTSSAIQGMFTSVEDAREEVLKHIRHSKITKAKRRDSNWERRHRKDGTRLSEKPSS